MYSKRSLFSFNMSPPWTPNKICVLTNIDWKSVQFLPAKLGIVIHLMISQNFFRNSLLNYTFSLIGLIYRLRSFLLLVTRQLPWLVSRDVSESSEKAVTRFLPHLAQISRHVALFFYLPWLMARLLSRAMPRASSLWGEGPSTRLCYLIRMPGHNHRAVCMVNKEVAHTAENGPSNLPHPSCPWKQASLYTGNINLIVPHRFLSWMAKLVHWKFSICNDEYKSKAYKVIPTSSSS